MKKLHTLLVLLTITQSGCGVDWKALNKPGSSVSKPDDKKPVNADANAADLFNATARMLEKGVFKDTNQMWSTVKSSTKTLDIDLKPFTDKITEHLGQIGENKSLTSDVEQRDWAAKFRRLAESVSK